MTLVAAQDASTTHALVAIDPTRRKTPAFRWQPEADAIRHADYSRRALDRIAALGPVHVPVADVYISSDLPEEASKG